VRDRAVAQRVSAGTYDHVGADGLLISVVLTETAKLAEVEKLLEKSDSGQLWFVLSYVYCQMGRPQRAKETIDRAYEKMPDADAVKVLREAIYEKAAGVQR
jgi:hypothetical protein